MGNFRELRVWQQSKSLAVDIYKIVNQSEELKKDYRMKDQIRGSAISIASNIAEGDELKSVKHGIHHFYIAKGSCAELETQLIICKEISYIENNQVDTLIEKCNSISKMLHRLIKARSSFI